MTKSDHRGRGVGRARRLGMAALLVGLGVGYGMLAVGRLWPPYPTALAVRDWWRGETAAPDGRPPGRWNTAGSAGPLSPEQQAEIERLAALGYVAGTQEASGQGIGVVLHDPEATQPGYNLYSSGHGPEAILMDMEGREVHRWRLTYAEAFPGAPPDPDDFRRSFWRKVHLRPDGRLLAIFEGLGVLEVDASSKLLWSASNRSHHDMAVGPEGRTYVLTRTPRLIPDLDAEHPVLEDFIVRLDANGVEQARHSVLEAVRRSDFRSLMDYSPGRGDIFHTNSLQILDGRHASRSPAFRRGNALISLPKLNAIAIVDLELDRVVWALAGVSTFQHDPTLLDNGNLLIFDNRGARTPDGSQASRVIEIDAITQEIVWSFEGSADSPFFTECCGTNQRLGNGNTLITESETGQALEVTPEGRVVWIFRSPHRAGEDGELVATLLEVERVGPDVPSGWLQAAQ